MLRLSIRHSLSLILVALGCGAETEPAGTAAEEFRQLENPPFVVGDDNCPQAHCDARNSDFLGGVEIPGPGATEQCRKPGLNATCAPKGLGCTTGAGFGLGCSSNGSVAACSYWGAKDPGEERLQVFDADGNYLWGDDELGPLAGTSAPIVSSDNQIIAADGTHIRRYTADGQVVWSSQTGFVPISPVLFEDTLVVGSKFGPLTAYDVDTGDLLGLHNLDGYTTANTPAISDRFAFPRVYVVADDGDGNGRLYALRLTPNVPAVPYQIVWQFDFEGPSEASPTVTADGEYIIFDGYIDGEPALFGINDHGASYDVWSQPTVEKAFGSVALDPRGPWFFSWDFTQPTIERRSVEDGGIVEQIDVNDFFPPGTSYQAPNSPMVIGSYDGEYAMVTSTGHTGSHHLIAFTLDDHELLWSERIAINPLINLRLFLHGPPNSTAAQFPVLQGSNGPTTVAATWNEGPMFVGTTPCEDEG